MKAIVDETFSNHKFKISINRTFRRDGNKHGGSIMFYFHENVPCKTINIQGLPEAL